MWRFTPGFDLDLDPSLVETQPPHFRQALEHYGYKDPRLHRFILCCDDARYGVDFAWRDMAEGEALTIDFLVFRKDLR